MVLKETVQQKLGKIHSRDCEAASSERVDRTLPESSVRVE
ncbi:unnamed protein product [Brassica oleracea]